jgi:hypothetical protein
MNKSVVAVFLYMSLQIVGLPAFAQSQPSLSVEGKWQLSWQARMGMEKGVLTLQQTGVKLRGNFHSELGSPTVSGAIQGQNISFELHFEGKQHFAIAFTGKIDGAKMNGKFVIDGMMDGYDQHGENVQPTNYSWTATALDGKQGAEEKSSEDVLAK